MSNRLAIALVAIAVCGYAVLTYVNCALDSQCHFLRCGSRICGMSYDKQDGDAR